MGLFASDVIYTLDFAIVGAHLGLTRRGRLYKNFISFVFRRPFCGRFYYLIQIFMLVLFELHFFPLFVNQNILHTDYPISSSEKSQKL
jgi:hypothetical protein